MSFSDEEYRLEILRDLHKKARQSPFYKFYFKVSIPKNGKINLNTLQFNLKYLEEKGLIETDGRGGAKITSEGIDLVLAREPEKKDVFIIHGHDEKSVKEIEEIIKDEGFNPKYLRDFGSGSETLINKLNKAKVCSYAVVILTPDDWGTSQRNIDEVMNEFDKVVKIGEKIDVSIVSDFFIRFFDIFKYRARQNVIFELGFFQAILGDEYVTVLLKKGKDIKWDFPSDIHGGYYIEYEESVREREEDLKRNLQILRS